MRRDRVLFDAENPFNDFSNCSELTILLGTDRFIFAGTINSISIVRSFPSKVSYVDESEQILDRFTIPLSLIVPIFKLDTREKDNVLTLETSSDGLVISYNDVPIRTSLYSANGATIRLLDMIDTEDSEEINPILFTELAAIFGIAKDNFCNVDGDMIFISDSKKCVLNKLPINFHRQFSLSLQFVRLMRTMKCTKLFIKHHAVAVTKDGTFIVEDLRRIQDTSSLLDFKFSKKLVSALSFELKLNKYMGQIKTAVGSAELNVQLNLAKKQLNIVAISGESVSLELGDHELSMRVGKSVGDNLNKILKQAVVRDQNVIKTLATFKSVNIYLRGTLFIIDLTPTMSMMSILETE